MVTLVVGMPGSGKTTYVKKRLDDGICYDLDAIAAAFRLRKAHEEYHSGARMLADLLLWEFIDNAQSYADDVYIIRTAPGLVLLQHIAPDRVVCCRRGCRDRDMTPRRRAAIESALQETQDYCRANNVPFVYADE